MDLLQHNGILAGDGGSRWVFGFKLGNGFFVGRNNSVLGAYPYVEHVDFPTLVFVNNTLRHVERPVGAALDLAVSADTLYVVPSGGIYRFRFLDLYDLRSGDYIMTRAVPGVLRAVAVAGDRLFTIERSGLFPTINHLRAKEIK